MSIQEMLPILIPLVIIQWTLNIIAIVHIFRHPNYRFGNQIMWVLVVIFISIFGAVAYFLFGRGEKS